MLALVQSLARYVRTMEEHSANPDWEHAAAWKRARRWALDLELSLGHYAVSQLMRTGKPGVPQSPRTERWGRLLQHGRAAPGDKAETVASVIVVVYL